MFLPPRKEISRFHLIQRNYVAKPLEIKEARKEQLYFYLDAKL